MKKRILPFIVAMSAVLPIQSFAAESVEASAKESNEGQWEVVWQSSNTIVKYKVVKWKPMKYKYASFVQKEQPVVAVPQRPDVEKQDVGAEPTKPKQETKPVEVQQEPKQEVVAEPKLEAKSTEVKPRPVAPSEEVITTPSATPKQEVTQNEASQKVTPAATDTSILAVEQEVVRLVNAERAKEGLQPLTMDVELQKVAKKKSEDMKAKNYFSHTSPTYGSPFDMMKQFGITYKSAGENIAKGQTTAQQVMDAWMNSAGHRANIMSTSFTHIGVGYVAGGHYWTQMFIKK